MCGKLLYKVFIPYIQFSNNRVCMYNDLECHSISTSIVDLQIALETKAREQFTCFANNIAYLNWLMLTFITAWRIKAFPTLILSLYIQSRGWKEWPVFSQCAIIFGIQWIIRQKVPSITGSWNFFLIACCSHLVQYLTVSLTFTFVLPTW